MIRAFRIINSIDRGDTVTILATEKGIDDPKAATVVLDTDDIENFDALCNDYAIAVFKPDDRPKIMVNGVEMRLQSLQFTPVYAVQEWPLPAARPFPIPRKAKATRRGYTKNNWTVAKTTDYEITIVVAWE